MSITSLMHFVTRSPNTSWLPLIHIISYHIMIHIHIQVAEQPGAEIKSGKPTSFITAITSSSKLTWCPNIDTGGVIIQGKSWKEIQQQFARPVAGFVLYYVVFIQGTFSYIKFWWMVLTVTLENWGGSNEGEKERKSAASSSAIFSTFWYWTDLPSAPGHHVQTRWSF